MLGDRYLETGTDLRHAARTLKWTRDELIAAAKRYHQETGLTSSSFARLLKVRPEPPKPEDRIALAEVPTLEEFQGDFDPTGFYSEAELIQEFEKRYAGGDGPSAAALRKSEQNNRLRQRLRSAIDTLENWLATTPKPNDPISIWIEPVVAHHLTAIGVITIEDLTGLVNRRGNLWYRRIPKFGAVRAKRVVGWLRLNRVLPVNERALLPYRQIVGQLPAMRGTSEGIAPLQHLSLPVELDGSMGTNRSHECQIPAQDDMQAIRLWLLLKGDNDNTKRAYLMWIERFLLWLTVEKMRPLSSATPGDCHEYTQFLKALATPGAEWPWRTVRGDWVGDKVKRWNLDWKPFVGVMSASSRNMAVTVLKGLFAWLVENGYLRWNPWSQVKKPIVGSKRLKVNHALNERQWVAITDELEATKTYTEDPAEDERYCRLRFLLWLGYSGGLRQNEMASLTAENLVRTPDGNWELKFIGKGGVEREVPMAGAVFAFLQDYMAARGHGRLPTAWSKALPLLTVLGSDLQKAQKEKDQRLAARSLSQIIKRHFSAAADRLEDLIDEDQLRQASTHWLRHTAATIMINKGAEVVVVQEILGHADSATTAQYTHADRKKKREAVEALL